jgi:hypothetical protein
MKKLIATVLTVAGALCASAAFGEQIRVAGESLDSGLGALASTYSADEYRKK